MTDENVVLERDGIRVTAVDEYYPTRPEHMGWPEVVIGLYRDGGASVSWDGAVDLDAVMEAYGAFSEGEALDRWLRIFAEDLLNADVLDFAPDELAGGVTVRTGVIHGYSQGDAWLVIQWRPLVSEHWDAAGFDADDSELGNWARGDVVYLEAEEYVAESDHWEAVAIDDPSPEFYVHNPALSDYLKSEAGYIWEQARGLRAERQMVEAVAYYETLEVTR